MNKREAARELEGRLRTKWEHEEKKQQAEKNNDYNLAYFHEKEIREMERRIAELEGIVHASGDECPCCDNWVVPVSNRCPKCDCYMG